MPKPTPSSRLANPGVMRWLLGITRPVLSPLVWSTVCRILDQLLDACLLAVGGWAAVTAALRAAHGESFSGARIASIIAVMVGLSLVKGFIHYGEQFFGHYVAFKALELLRRQVFLDLVPRSPAALADTGSGDLLARITTDIDRIEVFFAHTIAPAISAVVVPVLVLLGIGTVVSWPMAGVAALVMVLAMAFMLLLGARVGEHSAAEDLGARGAVAQEVHDSVHGITEVVGYGAEAGRMERLSHAEHCARGPQSALGRLLALRRATGQLGLLLAVSLPLLAAWPAARDGEIAPALLFAAAVVLWRSWEVVRGVEDFSTALNHSLQAAQRVYDLAHRKPAVEDGPEHSVPATAPAVAWQGVSFGYPDPEHANEHREDTPAVLHQVTAYAEAGRWTALVGATGSGKSTLVRLLIRAWDPDRGTIEMNGKDIRGLTVATMRDTFAVASQHAHLFAGSVAENLRLVAPDAPDDALWHALTVAAVENEVRSLGGLSAEVGEGGARLSGGQRQRVALARTILENRPALILDEFTAHLDPALAAEVRRRLRAEFPTATIIEVTHTLDHLEELADQVVVLDRGEVVGRGTPTEQLADCDSALSRLAAHTGRRS